MAKVAALLVLALVGVATAHPTPLGGIGIAHKTAHISSHHVVSPYVGMEMMGYPGIGVGHTVSHHSVSHTVPHYGMGMMGIKGHGLGYGGYALGMG